ncbi:hypothetical protein F5Y17DRAFT_425007 [Xylariaceae sp. FL0594]|nr:hypothetical protein F5Y17DRAFT_425007 [Xylariaceae sp. FL0594]
MSAPSPSQCYRAVRRHLRPHHDSPWVPDSLLLSAFERYAATFRTGARYGSSVPGPLEHRKRLAKRHMGDLHFGQSHSAAPIWELANLVDLNQWQWKPPTSHDTRRRQTASAFEVRTHWDTIFSPLRSFIPQSTEQAFDHDTPDHEVILPNDVILTGVADELFGADSTPAEIITEAIFSLSQDILRGTNSAPLFHRFCDHWKIALAKKWVRGETVCTILTGILDGLDGKALSALGPKSAEQQKLTLVEATMEGISGVENDENMPFDAAAWNGMLHGVSRIQLNTTRIFSRAMNCIPDQHLQAVVSGINDNLYSYLVGLGRATKRATFARQAAKMAVPLKAMSQPVLQSVLDDATRRVLEYSEVKDSRFSDIRFGWLQLLARLPNVDECYLGQVCAALQTGRHSQPISDIEVCQVLLVWANSRAPLEQYTKLYSAIDPHDGTRCYRRLGARLWHTHQFHRIRPFVKFLHIIGREHAITLLAKGVPNPHRQGPCALANLAIGMRRPRVAIDILCLYEESRRLESQFWESRLGFRALENLVWVPGFDHKRLLAYLGVKPALRARTRPARARCRLSSNHIAKIAAIGTVVGLSPHLSRRKAFFFLTLCYRHLRKHNSRLPVALMRALFHNVTRCLVNGEPGITARLRYILTIIHKEMGSAATHRIGLALSNKRRANLARLKFDRERHGAYR